MSDNNPPEDDKPKPDLTFQPSIDNRDQLDAFLKGVVQQYVDQNGAQIAQEPSSQRRAPSPKMGGEDGTTSGLPNHVKTAHSASNFVQTGLPKLKDPPVYHSGLNVLPSSSIISQPIQNSGATEMGPAQVGMHPSNALRVLPGYAAEPLASELPNDRSTQNLRFRHINEEASAFDFVDHPPSRAAAPKSLIASTAEQEAKEPPSSSSKATAKNPKVDHELIQRQLDSIGRSSLLRARTVDIHAPDPEMEAPPNETSVGKRRRLERINGRRKRAKKLIEIDSLNDQLVSLSERNKELKSENADFRQKISVVKRLLAEGRTNFAKITTRQVQLDAPEPPRQEQAKVVASRVSTRPSESHAAALLSFPSPQQQYPLQRQPELPPMASHSQNQQSMLSSLLSGHPPLPPANYAALLAKISATNQNFHLVGQPPYLFQAPEQQPPQLQLTLQQQLQLQSQLRMQNQLQRQRQLQWQLPSGGAPPQQEQRFNPAQLAGMSQTTSSLLLGASQGLQNPTAASFAQLPPTATTAAAASYILDNRTATRPGSPPPKNVKELKAWIQKHQHK